MKTVTMLYSDYKNKFSQYEMVYGTYNKEHKTISVKLPDDVEYNNYYVLCISPNNVKRISNKAVMIKMPYCCEYRYFRFFVSAKIVTEGLYEWKVQFPAYYKFTIKNEDEQIEISASEMAEFFKCSLSRQEYPILHVPEHIEPLENVEALEELRDE